MKEFPDSSEKDHNEERADRLLDLARFDALHKRVQRLGARAEREQRRAKGAKLRHLIFKAVAGIAILVIACYFLTGNSGAPNQEYDYSQVRKLDNKRGLASEELIPLINSQDYNKLLDTIQKAPDTDINNEYEALALMHIGKFEDAIEPLKQIVENNNQRFVEAAFLDLMLCYKETKRPQEAKELQQKMERNKYISPQTLKAAESLL